VKLANAVQSFRRHIVHIVERKTVFNRRSEMDSKRLNYILVCKCKIVEDLEANSRKKLPTLPDFQGKQFYS